MGERWRVVLGDSLDVLAAMEPESVDGIVCDPPYGLEFMGREWDRFREDDRHVPGYNGREAGVLGRLEGGEYADAPAARRAKVAYGGGDRPATSRCEGCGKRDQFRKPHDCPDGTGWRRELIDPHAAPPSMLAFQSWCREWARLALRVLKPGGYLLAFGGTRTYHRMASGVEDAGFEVRDQLQWLYGSGFPKSLDVSRAIDNAAGAEREVVGVDEAARARRLAPSSRAASPFALNGLIRWGDDHYRYEDLPPAGRAWFDAKAQEGGQRTAPATPDAERWQGWGTALKPAHEPIVVARKPLAGTVAANVLAHGTGALNVDGCRIDSGGEKLSTPQSDPANRRGVVGRALQATGDAARNQAAQAASIERTNTLGRWPANVVLDPEAAALLDAETGELERAGGRPPRRNVGDDGRIAYGDGWNGSEAGGIAGPLDEGGGPSRFFYCAKASSAERNAGLDGFEAQAASVGDERPSGDFGQRLDGRPERVARNVHPTVKPIDLMRWLVRLVTPPGGLVVDPFTGSGTTGCAAVLEGFRFVGIERDPEYAKIARARIAWWAEHPDGMGLVRRLELEAERAAVTAAGQEALF
jgi:DNA modification methylase